MADGAHTHKHTSSKKKRSSKKRKAKASRYPVERTQTYAIGASQTILIDVAKGLSAQNHRLYRQGRLYHVKCTLTTGAAQAGDQVKQQVDMWTIPDTWYVKKAWELAKGARDSQLSQSNRPAGRWDDFRVGWDSTYQTGTLPVDGALNSMTSDEAQLSKVHDATDSADHGFVMFGAARDTGNNLYGIIEQYDLTGNIVVGQPSSTSDAYNHLNPDAGLVEDAGALRATQGDNAPYDMDSFNGADTRGSIIQPQLFTTEDGVGRYTVSFAAPLGLIKVLNSSTAGSATAVSLTVTVAPGNYKGVKALEW